MRKLSMIEQVNRDSAERQRYTDQGRDEMRRIAQAGDGLPPLRPESTRAEAYAYFVQKQRAAAAAKDSMLGYVKFQYVPYERIDAAVQAHRTLEAFHEEMDALPGFWNFLARQRVHDKYQTPRPYLTFMDCFVTEELGTSAPEELAYIWEEDRPTGYEGLFDQLERINFVKNWETFATEHDVPVIVKQA